MKFLNLSCPRSYAYIAQTLLVPKTVLELIDKFDTEMLFLEKMFCCFSERKTGAYANRGYRRLFAYNYTVIYCVDTQTRHCCNRSLYFKPVLLQPAYTYP